jgi:hypothetical protein
MSETHDTAHPKRASLRPNQIWVVYARQKYDEPLHEIGTVEADDVDLAKVYAQTIFDEFAWVEMVIVPRHEVVTVIAR